MKLVIVITTYNRPDSLLNLLSDIEALKSDYAISVKIYDDKSELSYQDVFDYIEASMLDITYYGHDKHFGKAEYWRLINKIYSDLELCKFDFVYQLPDDVRLTPDFFIKSIQLFKSLKTKAVCLNLLKEITRNDRNWTNITPVSVTQDIIRTGWVDMLFIANRKFFELLNFEINFINMSWSANPAKSSGVGLQISKRIIASGYFFHQVTRSLVIHDHHPSVMHPVERNRTPIISNHMLQEKRYASIASMPDRVNSLAETIASLINQVDHIYVYLNNYKTIPAFLSNHKITAVLSSDEVGDIGDIGKFYFCEKINGYHFTCDDDIIYPADYVLNSINLIEQTKRRCVVSYHGRSFKKLPIKSYYHGDHETYRCLGFVPVNKFIQVPGTGVTAYHTETVDVKLSSFKASNMADIWMGILCQEQKIPVLCAKHNAAWIKESDKYLKHHSIYAYLHKKDQYQVEIINSLKWNLYEN